ncbi:UNVERIFIED_CONTAM: hypothetical protein Sradi_0626900 [Sesamum radiatum]|uniref:Uncharacterized protein n=1 Tax=Sesamum radiatum TaxID=300843 RepID=A0AAW2VJR7_SESRA
MIDDSRSNGKVKLKSKLQGLPELFACYVHPMPVSMVELIGKENEIVICVKCGHSEQKENILFVYRAPKNGDRMGYPSLIGHVPIALQIPENVLGRNICVERSAIQLTPDGELLVLLNSTKVPHCRDIDKRHLVSRFSSPDMSVLECVPASIFRWPIKGECKTGVLINEIMDATRTWFSGRNENHVFSPKDKDVAIWLLITTVSDPDSQCYQPCEQEANLDRCWRLALLVNNTVIIGSALDGGAAAVTSGGHGIIGRSDGLVYMWELSTGMKLGNLHSFKGSRVSCITTDTSNSGALAIASGGRLLVYLQPS